MTSQTLQTACQIIVALGIFFTAIGGYGSYFFGQRVQKEKEIALEKKQTEEEAKKAYSGVLEKKRELILDPSEKIYPKLEFGDSGAILIFAGEQGVPIFKIAKDNDIIIEIEDGSAKLSTKIRDKDGEIVAEIIKNEWKINPDNSWDRNYSQDTLEVKDPSGDIILQVKLVEDRIQLQAKLFDISGRRIGFGKSEGPEAGGVMEFTGANNPELKLKIVPLFKYPSDLHIGELVNDIKADT